MSTRFRWYAAWSVWVVTVAMFVGTVWLVVLNGQPFPGRSLPGWQDAFLAAASLGFATVGALIVSRRSNAVGWLLAVIGLGMAVFPFAEEYALRALVTGGGLPAVQWVVWTHQWSPALVVGAIPLLLLLFPDGRAPSPAWRPFGWVLGGGAALVIVATALAAEELQGAYTNFTYPRQNPVGIFHSGDDAWFVFMGIFLAMIAAAIGCVVALMTRLSRSTGEERQQLKWVAYAAGVMTVLGVGSLAVSFGLGGGGIVAGVVVFSFLASIGVGIPAAIAVAVFKYRLYELDFVVKKTVMLGTLAGFVSLVYVGVVVWLGSSLHGSDNNLLIYSAAAVVAVGFQPVRSRADRLADRVVYGKRATPYDVLSDLAHRMSDAYSVEDVLPKMVEAMASATGATRIGVWLRFEEEFRPVATWPHDLFRESLPIVSKDGGLPLFNGWDRVYPVIQQGELLGAITLVERSSDPMVPAKERLVRALAAQAGLVLRNVRLFEELKASRQRIVTAQDEERRRLERNIHDGAQQRLLTLAIAVGLTRDRVADPALCDELDRVGEELRVTLNELRELARGTYPAILTEAGLGPALESVIQRASVPATLASAPEGRLPAPVEATAYFVVSEALANAAKHANASSVTVSARLLDGRLVVEVADDGVGGAQATGGSGLKGLADRLAALDGALRLDSPPGAGTRIVAEIPVP